ncbi:golgin-84 isoform X2 [Anabrus simplex]|uniref:golgin-84 isoform X2 n=1 Tax=Anabrus simplex TaxID=316456 RepID=UPI0035A30AA2
MSWLKGLAGKAEDLLNQIDQNAAVAFQNEKDSKKKEDTLTEVMWDTPSSSGRSSGLKSPNEPTIEEPVQTLTSPKHVIKDSDEDLLEYLNNPEPADGASAHVIQPPELLYHEPSTSSDTTVVTLFRKSTVPDSSSSLPSASTSLASTSSEMFRKSTVLDSSSSLPSVSASLASTSSETFDDLSSENKLLRSELRAANVEISSLLQRAKIAEKSCSELQNKVKRLEDTGRSLDLLEEEIKIVQRHADASEDLADFIRNNPEIVEKQVQNPHLDKETIQKILVTSQEEVEKLKETCEKLRKERRDATRELEQYRTRALRVLQEKERIIAELRSDSSGSTVSLGSSATTSSLLDDSLLLEMESIQQEKELLREENAQISVHLQASREEVLELEKKLDSFQEQAANTERTLQSQLMEERRRRQAAEEDAKTHVEELRAVQEELTRQRSLLASRVQERELELTRLRGQLALRPASVSEDELEQRIHSLTQTLIQKQTSLETLTTERNAIRLQLQKLESKHRHAMTLLQQYQSRQASVSDIDDTKTQVPALFVESPFDTGISRRVKRAYSTLDAVSIRTGAFLRRYPLARILLFTYMIMLHLWVVFVLVSYTPSPQ